MDHNTKVVFSVRQVSRMRSSDCPWQGLFFSNDLWKSFTNFYIKRTTRLANSLLVKIARNLPSRLITTV